MPHAEPTEGVIRFRAIHDRRPLDAWRYARAAAPLFRWRDRLRALGIVGRDPERYEGAGYGNLSVRVERGFLVTGTQTSGRPKDRTDLDDLCLVTFWDPAVNTVHSQGRTLPSSESMTHGVVYDAIPGARYVFHAHAPSIWKNARALGIPVTDPSAGYGTPEMCDEVRRLIAERPAMRIVAMGGHQDGVIAFAPEPDLAGDILVDTLRASELRL